MKKNVSLESLARMVQEGFTNIESRMATKDDLKETREVLARAIEDLTTKLSAYLSSTREDYVRLAGRLAELEERLADLETGRRHRKSA